MSQQLYQLWLETSITCEYKESIGRISILTDTANIGQYSIPDTSIVLTLLMMAFTLCYLLY